MSNFIRRLLIIPARGNSKRIPKKNIKLFNNNPIINYVLSTAKKSNLFHKIHVSTESEKVAKVVKKFGIKIDFMRPKELSRDHIGTLNVLKFVYNKYLSNGYSFDEVWTIPPCSPLLLREDLIKASKISKKNKNRVLLAITRYGAPIQWAFKKNNKNFLIPLFKKEIYKRSQNFKKSYYDAGCLAVFPKKILNKKIKDLQNKFIGFELPQERAVDIDDLDNWKFAEYLYKANRK